MFEARLAQGNVLKRLAEALKELVEKANFEITKEGIRLQAMDSSHVCLVHLELTADGFDFYRCDRPMQMGLDVGNLVKVLKCSGNEDVITLKAEDSGDTLTLMFEPPKQDRVTTLDMKLITLDSEQLDLPPQQDCSAVLKIPSGEYQRICRDLSSIGETVQISAVKETIKLTAEGDVGKVNVALRHTSTSDEGDDEMFIQVDEPCHLTFALRYLNNFAKATPLSKRVQLQLTRDLPILVRYTLDDDRGSLSYYLAPKIEDEEGLADDNESKAS